MRPRPVPLVVAAVLLVLLSLSDFPFPWEALFPGAGEPPDVVVYAGWVLGLAGLAVAPALWTLRRWSLWATVGLAVLNFLLAVPGVFEAPTAALRTAIAVTAVAALLLAALVLLPASRRALAAR